MKVYATSAELKARARGALTGHYLSCVGAYVTLMVMQYVITVPGALLDVKPPLGIILYYGLNFLLDLFFAIFKVGIACMFLSNACGHPINANTIFTGFWNSPGKAMQIQCFPSLLLFLPTILPDLCLQQFFISKNDRWLIYGLAIALIFLPLALYVEIIYSQVYFIMLDFPEMEAVECLRASRKLMKKNKGRYFYLMLSFLPLSLLGTLSCGIGNLFLFPYKQQTYANFYLDLIEKKQAA